MIDTFGSDAVLTGGLTGAGGLTKLGVGTLTLAGGNTYTGMTVVSRGVLKVTGSLGSTNWTINSGATLQFVTNTLNLAGTNLTINAGGPSGGLLMVTGNLQLGGSVTVTNTTFGRVSKLAETTGTITGSFSSQHIPGGQILQILNGNQLWMMPCKGTVFIIR